MALKIIFMGTPDFAVGCLERLVADGHEVVLVLSQPDKPKGRKMVLEPTPVKACALTHGLEVYQPETFKDNDEAFKKLVNCDADVAVVVAYGKLLPKRILGIPRLGCINVHASLLPKYRGAGPIQWAVINGETESGVTTMMMDVGMDTGDMLLKKKVDIPLEMNAPELHDRLALAGAELISETLKKLEKGELMPEKQDESQATYAPMLTRALSPIDWSRSALQIHNQIRGLYPWPSAVTVFEGKTLKIHASDLSKEDLSSALGEKAGTIVSVSPFTVLCGDGKGLIIGEVQLEGGKRMEAKSFLLGRTINIGDRLTDIDR